MSNLIETYNQVQNGEFFDWTTFLNRTDITLQEWEHATDLSSGWVTCACGNQCARLPRNQQGHPRDTELTRLGCLFLDCIEEGRRLAARDTLQLIEERSRFLLAEMDAQSRV